MDRLFSFPAAPLASGNGDHATPTTSPSPPTAPERDSVAAAAPPAQDPLTSSSSSSPSSRLHVRLKLLDERVFDVHVARDIAVVAFRAEVEAATAVPAPLQRLIYRGKLLRDGTVLATYDIQDGHTIHLVAKRIISPVPTSESPTASTTNGPREPPRAAWGPNERESPFLAQGVERTRARLQQILRSSSSASSPSSSSASTSPSMLREPGVLRPLVLPSSRPPPGQGDAWNLANLREALAANERPRPTVPPSVPLPSVRTLLNGGGSSDSQRQGNEQRAMAANDVAADLGLMSSSTPNLDHITQGILTVRTVLSTAAISDPESLGQVGESLESTTSIEEDVIPTGPVATTSASAVSPRAFRRGRRRFFVGQWLDVKDTVNQWLESTVMDISEDKILVHYHGWPSRWDEWIDFDSDRIAGFRTRTQHTANAQHMSPIPTTRIPNAPEIGTQDIRQLVPQLRDLMREVLPHVERLAEMCEHDAEQSDRTDNDELSEVAHLVAPLFDRLGRTLIDSSRQFDPILRPDLRQDERSRVLRHPAVRTSTNDRAAALQDSSVNVRDLVSTIIPRPSSEVPTAPRRSVDVHIHAIVSPSSLSSLATLARLGSAIAGAIGSRSNSASNEPALPPSQPNDVEDAFGLPTLRPLQGGTDGRSLANDITEPEDELYQDSEQSRTPLLSEFRRRDEVQSPRTPPSRQDSGHDERHRDFLSDDFFGPSFSQDSDDLDDPISERRQSGSHAPVFQYQELPSPPRSEIDSDDEVAGGSPRLGIIPEIAEAEARAQQQQTETRDSTPSSAAAPSSYPTFLEVMRRTLSGVRGFGFARSSSDEPERSSSSSSSGSLVSSAESSSAENEMNDDSPGTHELGSVESSHASESSIEEDLDGVD